MVLNTKTDADHIAFISSSGHCTLECSYCIVHPVARNEPTLCYEDIAFLLDRLGNKTLLIFSGKGDFFAGYARQDRLLERLLERNVEVALDINGVLIHEYPELEERHLERIRYIHLTMHYRQLVEQGSLETWKRNAFLLREGSARGIFVLSCVLSPPEKQLWRAALEYYEEAIFAPTGQKIVLIRDVNTPFSPADDAALRSLEESFSHLIEEVRVQDFAELFRDAGQVLCPAGHSFFRIWNDGAIHGCTYIPELGDCGNLKERRFEPRPELYRCKSHDHCECDRIARMGKMKFATDREPRT